jgi:hypothetical protein
VAVYYQTAGVLVHESLISRAKDALDRVHALKADQRAKKEKLLKDCERLSEVPPGNEENEGPLRGRTEGKDKKITFQRNDSGQRIVNIDSKTGMKSALSIGADSRS